MSFQTVTCEMAFADYLRDCMSDPALVKGPAPIDEFCRAYCVRCVRSECSRAAPSAFQRRAANWRHDLFEAPPRAADQDPAYDRIRAKLFVQGRAEVGPPYPVQGPWAAPQAPAEQSPPEPEPSPSAVLTPVQPVLELEAPVPVQQPPAHSIPLGNTPFSQGTTVGGGPAPSEAVSEPGSTYTFGD